MHKRLFVVFLLGFSSGLPLALLSSTLQAWYASSGSSILATGLLSLISIPYAYRFLWGPVVDQFSLGSLGKRRSWILFTQIILLIGFYAMTWMSPQQNPQTLALLGFILTCFSATQDLVIDAQRIEYLNTRNHALGASVAVLGYRVALLLSGGLALILAAHWGWVMTYRLMSLLMLVGIVTTLCSQEPASASNPSKNFKALFVIPFKELIIRPGFFYLCCFIFLYKLGEAFTTTSSGIVMPFLIQGLGFSLDVIGYINKLLGISAILFGGICAGLILLRFSLIKSLFLFGILQALTNILFLILAIVGKNVSLLALAVFFDNFVAGMGSTALVALLMRIVNTKYTGTQFSILVGISALPRIFSGPFAALLQLFLGWKGMYAFSVISALLFIPFLILIKNQITESCNLSI